VSAEMASWGKQRSPGAKAFRRLLPLAAGSVVLAFLALASPAAAVPPERETFDEPFSGTQDCGTFTIEFSGTNHVRSTTHFDNEGNPVRIVDRISSEETDTNTTTGKTLDVRANLTAVSDLVEGTTTLNGQVFMANDPGRGAVIQDTGKVVFDEDGNVVHVAGPHEVLETEAEIFCDALA